MKGPAVAYRDLPGAQVVRAVDVLFLGPLMIYVAAVPSKIPAWARVTLGVFGAGTIGYNAVNFVRRSRVRI